MPLAPIILFVYNRPGHAEQTLNAFAANRLADESILYIYADGPKADASPETLENISLTRALIRSKKWCKEVFIIESEVNRGLAGSVIRGVTEVVNKHGKIIVLEDDIITSKYFLQFMNDALDVYSDEPKVLSIGALNFFATDDQVPDTFFVPIPDCWGWATWKNRWQLFEPNAQTLYTRLIENNLVGKFNLNGAYNFESMLLDQIKGNISSWAIRWQALAYLENKLSLYPKYSVAKNIGFGTSGTHGGADLYSKNLKFAANKIIVEKQPVAADPAIIEKMTKGYGDTAQPGLQQQLKSRVKKYLKLLLPPGLSILYRGFRSRKNDPVVWQGNFPDWDTAKKRSAGYENPLILEKTKNAILKVKNGDAAGERDSVLLGRVEYCWPVLTYLLKIALENNNQLDIIDFGGSLGSSYFQNRGMIPANVKLSWNVVEQPDYIGVGNHEIADENLKFFSSVKEAYANNGAKVLLLSSVLQYLEYPYRFLDEMMGYDFEYILVERTAFIDNAEDRITLQVVPPSIYEASYPAWFLNNEKFKKYISEKYFTLLEFESDIIGSLALEDKTAAYWRGYVFKRKTNE